jgi:hypothetical protein
VLVLVLDEEGRSEFFVLMVIAPLLSHCIISHMQHCNITHAPYHSAYYHYQV